MTYKGHIRNSAVVFDEPVHLPEGAAVSVEVLTPASTANNVGDSWAAIEKELDLLLHKAGELLTSQLTPPTSAAIENARRVLHSLRDQHLAAPSRILPDGEGGVVLEWLDAERREILRTFEVASDGRIERADFLGNRLQTRHHIQLS